MGRHAAPDIDASLRYAAELDQLLAESPAIAEAAALGGPQWTPSRRQLREARRSRRSTRRGRFLAAVVVVPMMSGALVGAALLWPGDAARTVRAAYGSGLVATGVGEATGRVIGLRTADCPVIDAGTASPECVLASVQLLGAGAGSFAQVSLGPAGADPGVAIGQDLRLLRSTATDGTVRYAATDVVRSLPVALFGLFVVALLLLLTVRRRGLGSLAGLLIGYAVIGGYALPALLEGRAPVLVGLSAAALILAPLLYLTQGFSLRTTTALAGALLGLGVTGAVGTLLALTGQLTGFDASPSGAAAAVLGPGRQWSTLVLCAALLAVVGVLADITATQTRAVWDLHTRTPRLSPLELYVQAVRTGRVHLSTAVPTLALTAAGAALPLLLVLFVTEPSLTRLLTDERLVRELIRLAAGAAGVLAAVPLTTALATLVVTPPPRSRNEARFPPAIK